MLGGKITSLVGHSGSGKSTILNLIPRIYDAYEGEITIDNQSIYKTKINSLRSKISFVSQDTNLFDDTIKNNIAYAKSDASQKEIERACKFAAADEFIDKLSQSILSRFCSIKWIAFSFSDKYSQFIFSGFCSNN